MTATLNLEHDLFDNPIARKEMATAQRSRGKVFWRLAIGLSALLFVLPFVLANADFEIPLTAYSRIYVRFSGILQLSVFGLGTIAGTLYVMFLFRTIAISGNIVVSERRAKTWELLLLTGMGTWRVVLGKWLGAMGVLRREYMFLFAVRAGFAFWLAHLLYLLDKTDAYYYSEFIYSTLPDTGFHLPALLTIIGLMAVFTVLEIMFTTAIGVCMSFLPWKQSGGITLGFFIRVGLVFLPPIMLGLVYAALNHRMRYIDYMSYDEVHAMLLPLSIIAMMFLSLADNGLISTSFIQELPYREYLLEEDRIIILTMVLGGMALYVLFTLLFLRLGKMIAYWQGVNSDALMVKTKPKRELAPKAKAETITETAEITEAKAAPVEVTQTPGSRNIFGLDSPQDYRVEMFHYRRTLSRLLLRATKNGEAVYLQFSDIRYLDIPAGWQGAAFDIADDTDLNALLKQQKIALNSVTEAHTRLYMIQQGDTTLRIVAGNATLLHELNDKMT